MGVMSTFRRAALTIGVVALGAFAAYGVYWHIMAGKLREELEPWAAARRLAGYDVRWKKVDIGGFPLRFRFRFRDAHFAAERPAPVVFDVSSLDVWAEPWNFHHWRFSTGDVAHLADPLGAASFDLDHVEGSARSNYYDALALDVRIGGVHGTGIARGFSVATANAHIEVPAKPPRSHHDTALTAVLGLNRLTLPEGVAGFGKTVGSVAFSADLKGGLPPGPLLPALSTWRDSGGTVELRYFRLRWGGLLIDANGTLALDEKLQPEGALSAEITGQDAAVDLAVTSGALQPADAGLAKAVLGLLAKPGPGGEKAITVPLTLQKDRIYLGSAVIASIPHISWE